MITKLFSIFDRKTGVFSPPQSFVNSNAASRAFGDEINSGGTGLIARHPEDYDLYYLGDFDDNQGFFVELISPVQLVVAGLTLKA